MIQIFEWLRLASTLLAMASSGYGTHFSAVGDVYNPVPFAACLRRDMVDHEDFIIAHRTLPCGTKVVICDLDTHRITIAVVGERGPWGKFKRGPKKGQYKALIDMSPLVRKKLRAKGFDRVFIIPIRPKGTV